LKNKRFSINSLKIIGFSSNKTVFCILKPIYMNRNHCLFGFFLFLVACQASAQVILSSIPDAAKLPPAPDYTNPNHWAALPTKHDAADSIPRKSGLTDGQNTAQADVFFIHPTIYTYQPEGGRYEWNGDVNDAVLNAKTDFSTILNQATVFNGSCRVYAPRYRQAHFYVFRTANMEHRKQTLDVAYEDVKKAFEYYLKNYHNGRPLVIASHSQGTMHARRLMREFFDGKPLQKFLVCGYLIGSPIQPNELGSVKAAQSAGELGGFVCWNTFAKDFLPDYHKKEYNTSVCTNPLTWTTDTNYAPKELNTGSVALKYTMKRQAVDAQVHEGILWINKPYIIGRMFLKTKIWHQADINLFWQNMRDNVALRLENYLKK
jgi:Protein of unknown function (DUF3089)